MCVCYLGVHKQIYSRRCSICAMSALQTSLPTWYGCTTAAVWEWPPGRPAKGTPWYVTDIIFLYWFHRILHVSRWCALGFESCCSYRAAAPAGWLVSHPPSSTYLHCTPECPTVSRCCCTAKWKHKWTSSIKLRAELTPPEASTVSFQRWQEKVGVVGDWEEMGGVWSEIGQTWQRASKRCAALGA